MLSGRFRIHPYFAHQLQFGTLPVQPRDAGGGAMKTWSTIAIAASGLVTAGCFAAPPMPPTAIVSASDATSLVECQIREALVAEAQAPANAWLNDWAVGVSLSIQRNLIGTATASATWTIPVAAPQGLSILPTMRLSHNRLRKADLDFVFRTNKFISPTPELQRAFAALCSPEERARRGQSVFYGDIGIREWLAEVTAAANRNDAAARPRTFAQKLEFGFIANAGAGPSFKVVNLTGSAGVTGEVNDLYSVSVAFTYVNPDDFMYSPVWVVNLPYRDPVRPPYLDGRPSPDRPRVERGLRRSPGVARRASESSSRPTIPRDSIPPAVQLRLERSIDRLNALPLSTPGLRPYQ